MADFKIKLKDASKKTFSLPTNEKHRITLIPPRVFVLDVEDAHFHFDRNVLLPELSGAGAPVLDARRVTGLGVIFAALFHARRNPSQGLFVTGHTDAAGTASYNQKLSQERAQSVSLLLRGKREDWRKLSAKVDAVDDYQTVLRWQHQRAGWECNPGLIDNKLTKATRAAIHAFQERYNQEVDAANAAGHDSPFRQKIGVDGTVGAETWGAFYDLYMSELMELLDLTAFSALEQAQGALKPPPGMTDFVGCGEHIPFNPARRKSFEKGKDEHLDGPQKNPADRRVEILFFDPGEEVDLVCHPKPGACEPRACPVYIKIPHRQLPIGIPKGLTMAEVNLRLTFVDPEGKVRPLPEGLPVQARFGDLAADEPPPEPDADDAVPILDDEEEAAPAAEAKPAPSPAEPESVELEQEPTALVGPDGSLQLTIPRKASSLFLRLLPGEERRFVTADPKVLGDQKLATKDEACEAVGAGRVFFRLPAQVNSGQAYFELPTPAPGVTFKDGAFLNVDSKQTQIGTREEPLELRLAIRWQHFKFEYFDRWTSSVTTVPQSTKSASEGADGSEAADAAAPPLVMDGIAQLVDAGTPGIRIEASTAWAIVGGKQTVHCLAWVRRETVKDQPRRELPEDTCTARFVTTGLFVRTDGDGSSPDAPRAFVTLDRGDERTRTPSADRMRLYDLPREWRTRLYPARLGGETPDKARPFEKLASTLSTLEKPYVVSLDTIVLSSPTSRGPDKSVQWDDSKLANRFTIFDHELRVYKPDPPTNEPYFTRLDDLKPKPIGPVLLDFPPFTRLIARAHHLYDVFEARTDAVSAFNGAPVGARLAVALGTGKSARAMTTASSPFQASRPNSTNSSGPVGIGYSRTAVLRCCGHDKDVELFNVLQYVSVTFDFARPLTPALLTEFPTLKTAVALPAPPPDAMMRVRDCLTKIADRWNGNDNINNTPPTFEVDGPTRARGRYVAFLSHGDSKSADLHAGDVRINLFKSGRSFMAGDRAEGFWHLGKMRPEDDGTFTAAHEAGHIFSQPDEYLNTDDQPSYGQPNIGEWYRSCGTPYGIDRSAMMVGNREVRTRYYWDMLLFARQNNMFEDAKTLSIRRGALTFSTDVTPLDASRVRFPLAPSLNAAIGPLGLCDVFTYVTGRDGFTAGSIDSTAKSSPYDGFVVVRVKMAFRVEITDDFDALEKLMDRARTAIDGAFNRSNGLAVRGQVAGKAARLRVIFAPRFVCSTFPKGDGATAYLESLDPALPKPFTRADYEQAAKQAVIKHGVHVNVRVAEGTAGVDPNSAAGSAPRSALVRGDGRVLLIFSDSRFDDDVVAMFGQMVGAPAKRTGTAADFAALVGEIRKQAVGAIGQVVT